MVQVAENICIGIRRAQSGTKIFVWDRQGGKILNEKEISIITQLLIDKELTQHEARQSSYVWGENENSLLKYSSLKEPYSKWQKK